MIEEFLSKTENPYRLAQMILIGVFTDEDSSLELVATLLHTMTGNCSAVANSESWRD